MDKINLNKVGEFAKRARRDLMEGVDAALAKLGFTDKVPDAPIQIQGGWTYRGELIDDVEFGGRWQRLKAFIEHEEDGRMAAVERAAYTWFNRLAAIRILEKRNLVPPQLEWADRDAHVPAIVHRMRTGRGTPKLTSGENAALSRVRNDPAKTREQFAILVGAFCRGTPILQAAFGEIEDWTMLLVPPNLLAEGGLVDCLNDAALLSDDDYRQDELIGWLYQYYIAERHDEVYDGFKKNKKAGANEIPAATQIFTPNWIVKHLVENTLQPDKDGYPEKARFMDPCCGSGHILLEWFRHLLPAYEDLGYSKKEAIKLILTQNIIGIDIDPRARQLSAFALLLAAAKEDASFADAHVQPRVFDTVSLPADIAPAAVATALGVTRGKETAEISTALAIVRKGGDTIGSLLKLNISPATRELAETRLATVADSEMQHSLGVVLALTASYSALVTNPPYLGADKLKVPVKEYLEKHYKDGKSDLMTAFMVFASEHVKDGGRWGMINLPSWMFIGSFEDLRRKLVENEQIVNLVHNGRGVFGSDFGSVTFVFQKTKPYGKGLYRRLFKEHVQVRSLETIHQLFLDPDYGRYEADQREFSKIPGSPIAYWVSEQMIKAFENQPLIEIGAPRQGLATGCNPLFVRNWHEVSVDRVCFCCRGRIESVTSKKHWFPYNKGGEFRKWYGNQEFLVDWENDGIKIRSFTDDNGKLRSRPQNLDTYFQESVSWSKISSGAPAFRFFPVGFIYDVAGTSIFTTDKTIQLFLLGFCNSTVAVAILKVLSPTMNFEVGHIASLPILIASCERAAIETNVKDLITLSSSDWNEYETSWDFKANPLVALAREYGTDHVSLEAVWGRLFERRMDAAAKMKALEEENNRLFIDAYGLADELSPEVAWKDVSLTGNPFYRYKTDGQAPVPAELEARACGDAMRELLSYGMGVLMGRYSLGRDGLLLASQGETMADFNERVGADCSIMPDEDGIIPAIALDGGIFTDNLLHRMREFLSAAFGKDALPGNLNFIEAALGCKIDKYLTDKFFDDHVKTYSKTPIYWLYKSPKGYFKVFAYMHRMTGATAGLIRNKYLLPYIAHLERCLASESAKGSALTTAERKRVKEIEKAIEDCRQYDLALHDIAEQSIAIDLDDGVAVNWEKFKTVLARLR